MFPLLRVEWLIQSCGNMCVYDGCCLSSPNHSPIRCRVRSRKETNNSTHKYALQLELNLTLASLVKGQLKRIWILLRYMCPKRCKSSYSGYYSPCPLIGFLRSSRSVRGVLELEVIIRFENSTSSILGLSLKINPRRAGSNPLVANSAPINTHVKMVDTHLTKNC